MHYHLALNPFPLSGHGTSVVTATPVRRPPGGASLQTSERRGKQAISVAGTGVSGTFTGYSLFGRLPHQLRSHARHVRGEREEDGGTWGQ